MSRLGSICALLLLFPTATSADTVDAVNSTFCNCGLTCETQPGTFFGQSCTCHACTNGTIRNSTGLRGALNSTSQLSQSLQGPAVRSGWYCSYGRQLGGGRGGTYFCFVFACNPCR